MIKLPNSIEPAVMAENIVHLRDEIAAVDAKTLPATTTATTGQFLALTGETKTPAWVDNPLPATTTATTGQILKLTGENKTPAWADEYSYTPPAYSETETNTGRKWIDGKDVYLKVFTGEFPEITTTSDQALIDILIDTLIDGNVIKGVVAGNNFVSSPINYTKTTNRIYTSAVSSTFSLGAYYGYVYYTKLDPAQALSISPDVNREIVETLEEIEPEQEPEQEPVVKTTRKKK